MPSVLGVVGAGTMGAGIAQVACVAGFETHLHDPIPETLERTNLTEASPGRRVNLEVDVIAKYVEKLVLRAQS